MPWRPYQAQALPCCRSLCSLYKLLLFCYCSSCYCLGPWTLFLLFVLLSSERVWRQFICDIYESCYPTPLLTSLFALQLKIIWQVLHSLSVSFAVIMPLSQLQKKISHHSLSILQSFCLSGNFMWNIRRVWCYFNSHLGPYALHPFSWLLCNSLSCMAFTPQGSVHSDMAWYFSLHHGSSLRAVGGLVCHGER